MPKICYKEINFRQSSLDLISLINQVIYEVYDFYKDLHDRRF